MIYQSLRGFCFNPCSRGCFVRSLQMMVTAMSGKGFQSLFSWMFRSKTGPVSHGQEDRVSILVLVDVSFEVWPNWHRSRHHRVSILVLVDVSFEAYRDEDCRELTTVSILVLVDVSFE